MLMLLVNFSDQTKFKNHLENSFPIRKQTFPGLLQNGARILHDTLYLTALMDSLLLCSICIYYVVRN